MMIQSSDASAPTVDITRGHAANSSMLRNRLEVARQAEQHETRQKTLDELNGVLTRQLVKQLTAIAATTGLCRAIVGEVTDPAPAVRHSLPELLESLQSLSGSMIETTRRVRDLTADGQPGRRVVSLATIWQDIILVSRERLKLAGKQYRVQLAEPAGEARVDVVELTRAFLRGTAAVLAELPEHETIHFTGHRFADRYAMFLSDATGSHSSASEVRDWLDDTWVEGSALANDLAKVGFVTLQPLARMRELTGFVIWVPLT